jgi:FkbM family methyltransferase
MGLHREARRLRQLGAAGFFTHHALSRRLIRELVNGQVARDLFILGELLLWVVNWREVYRSHRRGAPLPPIRLRRGPTLSHQASDQVLVVLREVVTQRCYRRHITEPARGVLVDIGANIGMVTLDWAARMPEVTIHAYEADPITFETLKRNVEDNGLAGRVRVYNEAVGRGAGEILFHRTGLSLTAGAFAFAGAPEDGPAAADEVNPRDGAPRRAKPDLWFWTRFGEPLRLPAVGLAEVMRRAERDGPVKLVKIDVEGAEVDILQGAPPDTLVAAEQFVVEYHDPLRPEARARCEAALERAGFRCVARESEEMAGLGLLYAVRQAGAPELAGQSRRRPDAGALQDEIVTASAPQKGRRAQTEPGAGAIGALGPTTG